MKNQILLCLLTLCSAVVLNAQPMFLSPETITYKVREDTFYSDKAFKEPYRPIKKDSIITWTSEMSVGPVYSADVEAGWYVKYSINASYDENEKPVRMYTDALQVVDSELLTQEKSLIRIIPEYYLEVLSKKNLAMIFEKQPLWLKTLEECRNGKYGSDSLEDIFKPESYLLSNTIVSFSQNNYYLVKNIETIGDCKRLALLRYRDDISESTGLKENVYSDIYKKYQKDAYIDLFVRFDGDYVDLWINSKDDFIGRYIIASDVLREQIHNFMETKDIDLSAITWPRHADGTCDYEDEGGNATAGAGDFEDRLNKGFWVRDYYNEVILTRDRNTILSYVPKYKENPSTFAYELDSEVYWYEESIFDKCEYVFSKIFYTYFLYVFSASFYITDIQRIDNDMYQVVVETDNFSKDEIEKSYNSGCDWQDENIIIERFYLKFDGDYLYVYLNEKTNLLATYCAYSESEYAWLNEAVATNDFDGMDFTFPRHADGSCDYDEGAWKSARKSGGGIPLRTGKAITTKENLRVHSFEKTTSPVLITLAAGTPVEILGVGGEETIDGITSKWVHVMLAPGTTGTDGRHMTGTMGGWCFGGLVSATEKEPESADAPATEHAEPTENAAFPEAAESPSEEAAGADAKKAAALPIAPIAAGVAVFVILLAAILLAVRRRKGGKE